jgi:tetratricopeptide (TPR) repeat protein
MKKLILLPTFLLFISIHAVKADEGMWLPILLKSLCETDMQSKGLKLSAEDIYSVNKSSLKDAIVLFGGGCTGEIVSNQGLLFTNHHCGIGQVQFHSTLENDYIKNGFWAKTQKDELQNPGLSVTFIVRIEDVSAKVKEIIQNSAGLTQKALVEKLDELEKTFITGTHYEADIKAFDYGNAYYIFITETFKDVRLVGAPPQAVGEFGGDTDNWMWPRHTGDFSVFRIYADKENKPAEYSANNVPYVPKKFLDISTDGVKQGDFAMVYGFPGRTQQYLPAVAVEFIVNESNPAKILMRDNSLAVINNAMQNSDQVRIQYTAKESRISNAWKKWKGEIMGLKKTNAIEKKKSFEAEFTKRVYENTAFTQKYSSILESFKKLYQENKEIALAYDYFNELYFSCGPELFKFIGNFENLVNNFETLEKQGKTKDITTKLQRTADAFFKNFDLNTDRKIFEQIIPIYMKGCPLNYQPDYLIQELTKKKNALDLVSKEIYETSIFINQDKVNALIANPKSFISKLKKDKGYLMMLGILDNYRKKIETPFRAYNTANEQLMNEYVSAIYEIFKEKKIWMDANSTLRLAYGNVNGSEPRDGMNFTHYTTSEGILEKYQSGASEYNIPPKLLSLLSSKDFGNYADADGTLHTCFTSTSQTTGGNSGSPVLNAYGELVGLNFDRSWESTMSDIMFSSKLCRNIVCDIRYVLFIIDKYAGATHLIAELNLVNASTKEKARIESIKKEIEEIGEQLRINPDNAVLLTNRAHKYFALELYDDALKNNAAAIVLKKDYQPAVLLNARVLDKQNKIKEALNMVEKAVILDGNDVEAKKLLAELAFRNLNFKRCIEVSNLVLKTQPDAETMLLAARSHYMLNNKTEACISYKQAVTNGLTNVYKELETCD